MVGQEKLFTDRRDAGIELGNCLAGAYKNEDVLVLGIPRGGVEVAHEVAKILNAELSAIIAKKLPKPGNHEVAIGAISEGDELFLTPLGKNLNEAKISEIINLQAREVSRRVELFRRGRPLPNMENRTVILVDDGIATGATFVPAISFCRKKNATKIVVAAPISGSRYAPEIVLMADELVILDQPDDFYAVGQAYEHFHDLSDEQVTLLLENYLTVR